MSLKNESSHLTSVTDGPTLYDGAKLPKFFEYPTIVEDESIEYLGEIDHVWGEAPTPYSSRGLAHIDRKLVNTLGDFASMEEAIGVIDDIVRNGEFYVAGREERCF